MCIRINCTIVILLLRKSVTKRIEWTELGLNFVAKESQVVDDVELSLSLWEIFVKEIWRKMSNINSRFFFENETRKGWFHLGFRHGTFSFFGMWLTMFVAHRSVAVAPISISFPFDHGTSKRVYQSNDDLYVRKSSNRLSAWTASLNFLP